MRRPIIAVTQRVDEVASYREFRDCVDQRWAELLERCGLLPLFVPNTYSETEEWLAAFDIDGCILTGGNDLSVIPNAESRAPERDRAEKALLEKAYSETLPVLGVCRGLQMLNHHFGGSLTPVGDHVAVRHTVSRIESKETHEGAPAAHLERHAPMEVNSFHDYGFPVEKTSPQLAPLLASDDGCVEAVVHRELPWVGIMWHPEREESFKKADIGLIELLFGDAADEKGVR